uniref:Uncharacterized protein n=1 Tax=Anguilla anguilla TaxID=7936 RepID=A0A0E9TEH4_ANGAN
MKDCVINTRIGIRLQLLYFE